MSSVNRVLRPKCPDIAKAMVLSGMFEIVIIVIIFIMLVFAAGYNNMPDPADDTEVIKKHKYINSLIIASAIVSLVLVGVGIWHLMSSNRLKECVPNTMS